MGVCGEIAHIQTITNRSPYNVAMLILQSPNIPRITCHKPVSILLVSSRMLVIEEPTCKLWN